nr:RNA-directed DNA polymerase, eukaryota, reverse transcriptase zinc-binding domain protein [Tanacetum cinerariifolium]
MCSSNYPITILSDSGIEDAFSSTNTLDYTSASPDYFSASPGNTSLDLLEDLSKYLLASLAFSPFHDDPYMKVMQAYTATSNESHIPPQAPIAPPTVLPSSLRRARSRSSALPQEFENGESSYKTHLKRHEKQIETILNNLDELPLKCIEQVEENIEGLDIMDMINDQDIEHTIPPTPPADYPLMNCLSGRDMKPLENKPVPKKPNKRNPRGGVEQTQFERLKEMVEGVTLSNSNDRWSWSLVGSDDFSVSSVRKLIDNAILLKGISRTRWIKEASGETETCLRRHMLYSLGYTWNRRNLKIFGHKDPSMVNVYDEVVYRSFYWIRFQCKAKFSFIDWLKNPNLVLL